MTLPSTPEEQRKACRAALAATVETLIDLEIPEGIIVEMLATTACNLHKFKTVLQSRRRTSNDDCQGEPANDHR